MGRVSYLYGFISALAELLDPFHKLLKTNVLLQQSSRQRQVFQKVKYVFSSTLTMILPIKSLPLTIFLTYTNKFVGALLVDEVEWVEHPVYY